MKNEFNIGERKKIGDLKMINLFQIIMIFSCAVFAQLKPKAPLNSSLPHNQVFSFGSKVTVIESAIEVYYKNGKKLKGMGSIIYPEYLRKGDGENKQALLKVGRIGVRPFETDSIKVNHLLGIPDSGTWIFKIVNGRISLYSNYPLPVFECFDSNFKCNSLFSNVMYLEKKKYNQFILNFKSHQFKYIEKDNNGKVPYSTEVVKEYTSDYAAAYLYITKYGNFGPDYLRAILEYNSRLAVNIQKLDSLALLLYREKDKKKKRKLDKLLTNEFVKSKGVTLMDELLDSAKTERNDNKKRAMLLKILQIDKFNSIALKMNGDISWENKKFNEAYTYYTDALKYAVNSNWQKEVRKKIKKMNKEIIY